MSLRQYLSLMIFSTILCWIAWGMVLVNIDPFQTSVSGFAFFYVSLFLSLVGTLSLIAFLGYRLFSRAELPLYRYVQKSFQGGVIASALILLLLMLQGQSLLRWWSVALFVGCVGIWIGFQISAHRTTTEHTSKPASFV